MIKEAKNELGLNLCVGKCYKSTHNHWQASEPCGGETFIIKEIELLPSGIKDKFYYHITGLILIPGFNENKKRKIGCTFNFAAGSYYAEFLEEVEEISEKDLEFLRLLYDN